MRISSVRLALALGVVGAATGLANAQHAKLVLFGEENKDAAAAPVENTFVHPLTAPYHNENSFVTSDVRVWFAFHNLPDEVLGGGNIWTLAAQVRLALTDRLQLVAYKDGFMSIDTDAIDETGWVDVAAGLKYAIIQDYKENFHWSVGGGYELPIGDPSILQNDDEWRLWTSVDKGWDRFHLGGALNLFLADEKDDEFGNSDRLSWHVHADYYVNEWFSPVLEMNGYHILNAGNSPLPFHGSDVFNLGTGEGDPVITLAPGIEVRPCKNVGLRGAFEFPLTSEEDVWGSRFTFSAVYSF